MHITLIDHRTAAERRQRLRESIAKMATAIAAGERTPSRVELDALIVLCHEHFLPVEAARVRRWIGPS